MLVEELSGRGHDIEVIKRNERLRDPEYPFIASESDMVLRIDGEVISAEAKSVNGFASKLWGKPETDEFPIYYQCQTLHDLMVKGRKKCVVAALIGTDDLRIHWIDRDDDIITYIRTKEVEFWQRVQDRNPPMPATTADIKRLYQTDTGAAIEADEEIIRWHEDLLILKQTIKAKEELMESISTKVKARMGNAAYMTHNGQKLITWKENRPSKQPDWQKAYMDLTPPVDHINKFITEKRATRPFIIK
jgi:predicted phage-related endonuclease